MSPRDGFWEKAWIATTALAIVYCVRVAEIMPVVSSMRPVMLTIVVAVPLAVWKTREDVLLKALRDPMVLMVLCYTAFAVLGVPFAIFRGAALSGIQGMLFGMLVLVSFTWVRPTLKNLDQMSFWFFVSVVMLGALAKQQGAQIAFRLTTNGSLDPNDLAGVMALAFPIGVSIMMRAKGKMKIPIVLGLLIMLVVIQDTGSRGGLLGLVAGVFVFLLGLKPSRALVGVLAVLVVAPIGWRFAPDVFKDRMTTMGSLEGDYNATEDYGRLGTWSRGIDYAIANPITGLGMNNFPVAEGVRIERENRIMPWFTAHNMYVQAWAELGLIGGSILLLMLGYGFLLSWRLFRKHRGRLGKAIPHRPEYVAAIVSMSVSGFFLSHAYAFHLFGVLGFSMLAGAVATHERTRASAAPESSTVPPRRSGQRGGLAVSPRVFGPQRAR